MREQIQTEASIAISNNRCVLLELGTGVGKTKVALDSANGSSALIVYKQKPHLNNWKDEIVKWQVDDRKFTFSTYNSLHKIDKSFDYLILDEAHAITESRLEHLKNIKFNKAIYLSATVPYEKKMLLSQLGKYKSVQFSLQDAIDNEVLPEPNIYIHPYRLNDVNTNCVYEKKKKTDKQEVTIDYNQRWNYLSRKGIGLNIQCTEKQYYELITNDIEFWKSKHYELVQQRNFSFGRVAKNKWLNLASKRKMFTNTCKTNIANSILSTLKGRFIIFCSTIDQCNQLADSYEYNYPRVHSKNKNNQEVVDMFNEGRIDRLYNCSVLNEGMNLTDLDGALIIGVDSKELSTVQRMGRSMRSESPNIHIIKAMDTKDGENVDNIIGEYKNAVYVY